MSTELRNVPDCHGSYTLNQTRLWGGQQHGLCIAVTQRKERGDHYYGNATARFTEWSAAVTRSDFSDFFSTLQLTRKQAGKLAVELTLFAEGREIEEIEEIEI